MLLNSLVTNVEMRSYLLVLFATVILNLAACPKVFTPRKRIISQLSDSPSTSNEIRTLHASNSVSFKKEYTLVNPQEVFSLLNTSKPINQQQTTPKAKNRFGRPAKPTQLLSLSINGTYKLVNLKKSPTSSEFYGKNGIFMIEKFMSTAENRFKFIHTFKGIPNIGSLYLDTNECENVLTLPYVSSMLSFIHFNNKATDNKAFSPMKLMQAIDSAMTVCSWLRQTGRPIHFILSKSSSSPETRNYVIFSNMLIAFLGQNLLYSIEPLFPYLNGIFFRANQFRLHQEPLKAIIESVNELLPNEHMININNPTSTKKFSMNLLELSQSIYFESKQQHCEEVSNYFQQLWQILSENQSVMKELYTLKLIELIENLYIRLCVHNEPFSNYHLAVFNSLFTDFISQYAVPIPYPTKRTGYVLSAVIRKMNEIPPDQSPLSFHNFKTLLKRLKQFIRCHVHVCIMSENKVNLEELKEQICLYEILQNRIQWLNSESRGYSTPSYSSPFDFLFDHDEMNKILTTEAPIIFPTSNDANQFSRELEEICPLNTSLQPSDSLNSNFLVKNDFSKLKGIIEIIEFSYSPSNSIINLLIRELTKTFDIPLSNYKINPTNITLLNQIDSTMKSTDPINQFIKLTKNNILFGEYLDLFYQFTTTEMCLIIEQIYFYLLRAQP